MSGEISGRVVDARGEPVPGATVAVSGSEQPVSDVASLTGADGRFRRGGLAPGVYTLDVRKAGQPARAVEVEVADGQQTNLEVRLDDPMGEPPLDDAGSDTNRRLRVELATDRIDWSQVSMVHVALDYPGSGRGDAAGRDYLLTSSNSEASAWEIPMIDGPPGEYVYKIEYFLANGSRKTVLPTRGSDPTLVLDPRA